MPAKPFSMEDAQSEPGSLQNLITRSHGTNSVDEPISPEADARDIRDRNGIYKDSDDLIEKIDDSAFLEPGDLVELRYTILDTLLAFFSCTELS